ncbi:MAG: hypothetical protein A4E73_01718 [Syntrophaceae bacterium PtaU1.Bin231]|nr:MAG: hypothetical protein A4E73_01718 [Syntrophaceae bacterium PtaU1.Bin231]
MPDTEQLLTWIFVGAMAGFAAGSLVRRKLYFYEQVLAGLLGAVIGGILIKAIGVTLPEDTITFTVGDLIRAFIGAATRPETCRCPRQFFC